MQRTTAATALIALLALSLALVPAAAAATTAADADTALLGSGAVAQVDDTPENETASPENETETADNETATPENESDAPADGGVNVTVGQQLSTVIAASSDEVQTDFENAAFELSVEVDSDEARAAAIADRAGELRERAADIDERYQEATEAYEDGEITKAQYAQRIASLNAAAENVNRSYQRVRQRAANVSTLELRAAGLNRTALENAVSDLGNVSGNGPAALLRQFTAEADGEIEFETADGRSIEVESDDGERSREIERPQDDSRNFTVSQSAALETARPALSTPENGRWVLVESKIKQVEGAYEFEFALANASDETGEAEVRVDGSSGEIYRLEEEIEPGDDDVELPEGNASDDGELSILVAEGTPAANETVTLQVLADGEPAANVSVSLNGDRVGTTNDAGEVTVTLPAAGDVDIDARQGEAEGELEFEFDEGETGDPVYRNLNVDASLDGTTLSVTVGYNGSGVEGATVEANDATATTDASGAATLTLSSSDPEDVELEITKGEFETELTFAVENGSLVQTEAPHESEDEETEDEADTEEETEDETEDEEETETEDEETEEETETDDETEDETETEDDETDTPEDETDTPEEETDTPDDD